MLSRPTAMRGDTYQLQLTSGEGPAHISSHGSQALPCSPGDSSDMQSCGLTHVPCTYFWGF